MATDEIMTAEACKLLGGDKPLDRSTLIRWVQLGRIEPSRRLPIGRHGAFMFERADVIALRDRLAAEKEAAST